MKSNLKSNNLPELDKEYISFINVSKFLIVYLTQFLTEKGVILDKEKLKKFYEVDTELDNKESKNISDSIINYDTIRKNIDFHKKIDIPSMVALFPNNSESCFIF